MEGMNAGFELCSIDWGGDKLDCSVAIDKMGLMTKVFDGRSRMGELCFRARKSKGGWGGKALESRIQWVGCYPEDGGKLESSDDC